MLGETWNLSSYIKRYLSHAVKRTRHALFTAKVKFKNKTQRRCIFFTIRASEFFSNPLTAPAGASLFLWLMDGCWALVVFIYAPRHIISASIAFIEPLNY